MFRYSPLGVVEAAKANDPNTYEYFANEYQLNHLVSALDTPYVSIMDGITSMYQLCTVFCLIFTALFF
jgi:hypothetical protein